MSMMLSLSVANCLLALVWYGMWRFGGHDPNMLVATAFSLALAAIFAVWAVYDALRDIARELRRRP